MKQRSKLEMLVAVFASFCLLHYSREAVASGNFDNVNDSTVFCGVRMKFSGEPKAFSKQEEEDALKEFGNWVITKVIGLKMSRYSIYESAMCLCSNENETLGMISPISASKNSTDVKQGLIEGIGKTESWIQEDLSNNLKFYYRVINLYPKATCQVLQYVATTLDNKSYPNFLSSVSAPNSATNNLEDTPLNSILKLEELRKNGQINPSDYETKKKAILDSL